MPDWDAAIPIASTPAAAHHIFDFIKPPFLNGTSDLAYQLLQGYPQRGILFVNPSGIPFMNWQSLIQRIRKFLAKNVKFHPAHAGAFQLGSTSLRVNPTSGYMIAPGEGSIDSLGYGPGDGPYRKK
jgi:hypothetical protein